jgi:hypothetical protein
MTSPRQGELFATKSQLDPFDEAAALPAYRSDPNQIRARLHKILAEARAAEKLPWEPDKVLVYRAIFPHMAGWLPEEEAKQLRFDFATELARLEAA